MGKVKEWAQVEEEVLDMFNDSEFDKQRRTATAELLKILTELVNKHPEQRFSQILQNYGFVKAERPANPDLRISWQNEFYMEPVDLLKRVQARINDFKNTKG